MFEKISTSLGKLGSGIGKLGSGFNTIRDVWKNKGFEIFVGICVALIIIIGLYNIILGKKGTWADTYTYIPKEITKPLRQPPRDSKGETECRRCLQKFFKRPFHKDRPDFLRNPVTGGNFNLELDCFDPELRLAVEYNGAQHYKYIPYFHKNNESFLNQKYRDDMKRRMCRDNGIKLIEVPYTVKVEDIETFLEKELVRNGLL